MAVVYMLCEDLPMIHDIELTMLDGTTTTLGELAEDRSVLLVNVASKCGLTPQYAGLEEIAREYADRGLLVLGAPCNQFGGQEPGTNEEIAEFCSTTYGVTFPLTDKLEVNGPGQHPLFAHLTATTDAEGHTGDVRWNFEKWLITPDGSITRFSPRVEPASAALIDAIEAVATQA
jgi:glutathione peroxidase